MPRGDDTAVEWVAWLARRTSIGPSDLLAAPPAVFDRMLADELDQAERERRDAMQARLQKAAAGRR